MKSLLLTILFAGLTLAQSTEPRYLGPAAPNPATMRNPANAPIVSLTADEVSKLRQIIERFFPPPLEGQMLPEKLRTATVNVFMSSTCPHCAKEVPHFAELEKAGAKINAIFFEKDEAAEEFLKAGGWSHKPTLVGMDDLKSLSIRSTPTTILADAQGRITKAFVGELNEAQQKELLALATAK